MRKMFIVVENNTVQSVFADAAETVEVIVVDRDLSNDYDELAAKELDLQQQIHDRKVRQIY